MFGQVGVELRALTLLEVLHRRKHNLVLQRIALEDDERNLLSFFKYASRITQVFTGKLAGWNKSLLIFTK